MSYTPTSWNTGDTITASALNKIENGIANAGSAMICTSSYSSSAGNYVLDKTVQEIYDALLSGTPVYIKFVYGNFTSYVGNLYLAPIVKIFNYNYTDTIRICAMKPSSSTYIVGNKDSVFTPSVMIFSATGVNDYPVFYTDLYVPTNYVTNGGHE